MYTYNYLQGFTTGDYHIPMCYTHRTSCLRLLGQIGCRHRWSERHGVSETQEYYNDIVEQQYNTTNYGNNPVKANI